MGTEFSCRLSCEVWRTSVLGFYFFISKHTQLELHRVQGFHLNSKILWFCSCCFSCSTCELNIYLRFAYISLRLRILKMQRVCEYGTFTGKGWVALLSPACLFTTAILFCTWLAASSVIFCSKLPPYPSQQEENKFAQQSQASLRMLQDQARRSISLLIISSLAAVAPCCANLRWDALHCLLGSAKYKYYQQLVLSEIQSEFSSLVWWLVPGCISTFPFLASSPPVDFFLSFLDIQLVHQGAER